MNNNNNSLDEEKQDSLKPLAVFLTGALILFITMQLDKSNFALTMFSFGISLMLFSVILRFYLESE